VSKEAEHDWKFGVLSPENKVALHTINLMETFTGYPAMHRELRMNEKALNLAMSFINENYFFYRYEETDLTIDGILDKAKQLVLRKGIKGLVIDPYNYIEHKIPAGYTETQYVSELLTKIKRFKDIHNVHVFLVAHPTKMPKLQNGQYEVPNLYNISGSANFHNKTDNGMTVWRDGATNEVHVHIQKIRHKFIGRKGVCKFNFDLLTNRYRTLTGKYKSPMNIFLERNGKDTAPYHTGVNVDLIADRKIESYTQNTKMSEETPF
jgi:twinkle protein